MGWRIMVGIVGCGRRWWVSIVVRIMVSWIDGFDFDGFGSNGSGGVDGFMCVLVVIWWVVVMVIDMIIVVIFMFVRFGREGGEGEGLDFFKVIEFEWVCVIRGIWVGFEVKCLRGVEDSCILGLLELIKIGMILVDYGLVVFFRWWW